MSKQTAASNLLNLNLPMWDSFEAIFFVIAGLSVGLVFGILFPSIWRSYRRSYRKDIKYSSQSEKWDEPLKLKLNILTTDENESSEEDTNEVIYLSIFKTFTAARYFFHVGELRKAVSLYVEILTSESISKQDTNRALYELSQVYFQIGLYNRAFDTAFELLNRKPSQNQVILLLLKICSELNFSDKLNSILNTYKGIPDTKLKRKMSHAICKVSEGFLLKNDLSRAIEYSRTAVKWDRSSARALILLWETTSKHFWKKNIDNKKITWLALATDLEAVHQIKLNSKVSPMADAQYLSKLIEYLINLPNSITNYKEVEKEFKVTFDLEKLSRVDQKNLLESIFYAVILLQKKQSVDSTSHGEKFIEILSIITNNKQSKILSFLNYDKKHESYILLGSLAHECNQCRSFYAQFSWQCANCGLEESLFPVNKLLNDES